MNGSRKNVKRLFSGLLAASAVVLVSAVPASASGTAAAGVAPSCISTWTAENTISKDIWMANNCGRHYRLRMILNWHVDGDCVGLGHGARWGIKVPRTASLHQIETC
jgi:hypothetical protein